MKQGDRFVFQSSDCSYLHLTARGDDKYNHGESVEEMTCRHGYPSIIFKTENGLCLASEGVFAYNLSEKRRKH